MGSGAGTGVKLTANGNVAFVHIVNGYILVDDCQHPPLQILQVQIRLVLRKGQNEAMMNALRAPPGLAPPAECRIRTDPPPYGHQPVFEGFLASAADAVWEGTEGVGTGHQDFLSHTDEQIGIGGQEGINEIKMLHHHTLTPVYCLHNGVRQLMGLGEAHFKANVHMVMYGA